PLQINVKAASATMSINSSDLGQHGKKSPRLLLSPLSWAEARAVSTAARHCRPTMIPLIHKETRVAKPVFLYEVEERAAYSNVLPAGGIGVSFSILAICTRLWLSMSVCLMVNSFSCPASIYDGPGPASPTQYAFVFGGMVKPRLAILDCMVPPALLAPSSFPVTTVPNTLLEYFDCPFSIVSLLCE